MDLSYILLQKELFISIHRFRHKASRASKSNDSRFLKVYRSSPWQVPHCSEMHHHFNIFQKRKTACLCLIRHTSIGSYSTITWSEKLKIYNKSITKAAPKKEKGGKKRQTAYLVILSRGPAPFELDPIIRRSELAHTSYINKTTIHEFVKTVTR